MRLSAIWMTYSFTPPLSWTIRESPGRYSSPSIPTSYSSDWRNASSNVKSVTIGSLIVRMNPQVADLGSAYKLAPQSPGLPQTERLSIGVLKLILKLREVGSLSMRTIYSFPKRPSDQTYVNKHQQT